MERNIIIKAIAIILITIAVLASEASCIDSVAKKLHVSNEKLTYILTVCSVKLMEGDSYLFQWDKNTWARLYPDSGQTQTDQANRLVTIGDCQQITADYAKLINDCSASTQEK